MKQPVIRDSVTGQARLLLPAETTQFDYAFLVPSGGRVQAIPFITNPTRGNQMTQDLANVLDYSGYDWNNWAAEANKYRPVYKSITVAANMTAFNNVGFVSSQQFNPSLLFAGSILGLAERDLKLFKSVVGYRVSRGLSHYEDVGPRKMGSSSLSPTRSAGDPCPNMSVTIWRTLSAHGFGTLISIPPPSYRSST